MEYLFIILILVSMIFYTFSLFTNQIMNRKCFIDKKKLIEKYKKNNYSLFTRNNIDVNRVLEKVNKVVKNKYKIDSPLRNYTYSRNNLEQSVKNFNMAYIGKILNKLNKKFNLRYKLLEIESLNRKIDIVDNEEINVIFLYTKLINFQHLNYILIILKIKKILHILTLLTHLIILIQD